MNIWIAPYILLNWQQRRPWASEGTASHHHLQSPMLAITNLPGLRITTCNPCHQTKARRTGGASRHCLLCSTREVIFPKNWKLSKQTRCTAKFSSPSFWFQIRDCFPVPVLLQNFSSVCSSYRRITEWILPLRLCNCILYVTFFPFFLRSNFLKQTIAIIICQWTKQSRYAGADSGDWIYSELNYIAKSIFHPPTCLAVWFFNYDFFSETTPNDTFFNKHQLWPTNKSIVVRIQKQYQLLNNLSVFIGLEILVKKKFNNFFNYISKY